MGLPRDDVGQSVQLNFIQAIVQLHRERLLNTDIRMRSIVAIWIVSMVMVVVNNLVLRNSVERHSHGSNVCVIVVVVGNRASYVIADNHFGTNKERITGIAGGGHCAIRLCATIEKPLEYV